MANATHCNLRLPNATPVILCFNRDARAKFEIDQSIRCCLIAFYGKNVTTFDPLTLHTCSLSSVRWSNSGPNVSEIKEKMVFRWYCYSAILVFRQIVHKKNRYVLPMSPTGTALVLALRYIGHASNLQDVILPRTSSEDIET